MNNLLSLTKTLCSLNGISGRENSVREFIIKEISQYAECNVDALGNIIAFKKGEKRAKNILMLDAHMDEVGMMITSISNEGLLSFSTVGGISDRVLCGRRVHVNEKVGVIGCAPIHLMKEEQAETIIKADELYIDIGAINKEDAEKYVGVGDSVTFESDFIEFGNGLIKSKAIDDRFGCAVLIDMIKKDLPYDTYFTFTVQEELGLRGSKTAAFSVKPQFAIVVESTTAADISGVEPEKEVCNLNGGAVISFMDNASVYDRELFEMAKETAKDNEISCQIKRAVAGGNNAGSIIMSGSGVRTLAVSLPCRYLHSAASVAAVSDISAVSDLVLKMAEKMAIL